MFEYICIWMLLLFYRQQVISVVRVDPFGELDFPSVVTSASSDDLPHILPFKFEGLLKCNYNIMFLIYKYSN
jgi:hypothetical protein